MFVHNTAQYSYDYFPPNIQIIITAQMLSNGEEGGGVLREYHFTDPLSFSCAILNYCIFLNFPGSNIPDPPSGAPDFDDRKCVSCNPDRRPMSISIPTSKS